VAPAGQSRRTSLRLAVDAHVHFHQSRLVEPTLDSAMANFSRIAAPEGHLAGALLLAESSREHVFERLAETAPFGRWRINPVADEPQTVIAETGGHKIAIICGRQIRCGLGLEVLALGTTARHPDGGEVEETIDLVRSCGALPVVPWGFGKWIGRAGRRIRELFDSQSPESLFAGDNGGRLQILGLPKQLNLARRGGFRVLPGTDPFPFGADYRRVGGFGFLAAMEPDPTHPWQSLRSALAGTTCSPEPYGRALPPVRFLFNQGWIQVHNRIGPGWAAQ